MSLDTPAPDAAPAPEAGVEAPTAGGNKVVAQLAGKLGQTIRTDQGVSSDDIKGAVNSILAAAKGKLEADAVSDIEKKLNDAVGSEAPATDAVPTEDPAAAPAGDEQPVQEVMLDEDDTMNPDVTKIGVIQDLIRRASLEHELQEFPEGLAFDICEGVYVYIQDYNDSSTFIQKLVQILRNAGFKASPLINDFSDLNENGQAIYHALLQMEDEQLNPRPQNKETLPTVQPKKDIPGFSLNEAQKKLILSKLK